MLITSEILSLLNSGCPLKGTGWGLEILGLGSWFYSSFSASGSGGGKYSSTEGWLDFSAGGGGGGRYSSTDGWLDEGVDSGVVTIFLAVEHLLTCLVIRQNVAFIYVPQWGHCSQIAPTI